MILLLLAALLAALNLALAAIGVLEIDAFGIWLQYVVIVVAIIAALARVRAR